MRECCYFHVVVETLELKLREQEGMDNPDPLTTGSFEILSKTCESAEEASAFLTGIAFGLADAKLTRKFLTVFGLDTEHPAFQRNLRQFQLACTLVGINGDLTIEERAVAEAELEVIHQNSVKKALRELGLFSNN